ncbi:NUCLEOLAR PRERIBOSOMAL-ASSOCIATED PROTEIN [Anaeramoeba flamelloides]|uniref:NUCLEOLAR PRERIBOSOMAL-ASSOCIATED PROTEIN n=1 Tax=Anaeramoeba flamelloides TaxID=1746091 RepID=A0AAV7YE06_9EUKA|nr:NUCLEOLAR PRERIBOSOMAL-ASSOCIATED PROTEIN [Anaeramoeba flamelloides]
MNIYQTIALNLNSKDFDKNKEAIKLFLQGSTETNFIIEYCKLSPKLVELFNLWDRLIKNKRDHSEFFEKIFQILSRILQALPINSRTLTHIPRSILGKRKFVLLNLSKKRESKYPLSSINLLTSLIRTRPSLIKQVIGLFKTCLINVHQQTKINNKINIIKLGQKGYDESDQHLQEQIILFVILVLKTNNGELIASMMSLRAPWFYLINCLSHVTYELFVEFLNALDETILSGNYESTISRKIKNQFFTTKFIDQLAELNNYLKNSKLNDLLIRLNKTIIRVLSSTRYGIMSNPSLTITNKKYRNQRAFKFLNQLLQNHNSTNDHQNQLIYNILENCYDLILPFFNRLSLPNVFSIFKMGNMESTDKEDNAKIEKEYRKKKSIKNILKLIILLMKNLSYPKFITLNIDDPINFLLPKCIQKNILVKSFSHPEFPNCDKILLILTLFFEKLNKIPIIVSENFLLNRVPDPSLIFMLFDKIQKIINQRNKSEKLNNKNDNDDSKDKSNTAIIDFGAVSMKILLGYYQYLPNNLKKYKIDFTKILPSNLHNITDLHWGQCLRVLSKFLINNERIDYFWKKDTRNGLFYRYFEKICSNGKFQNINSTAILIEMIYNTNLFKYISNPLNEIELIINLLLHEKFSKKNQNLILLNFYIDCIRFTRSNYSDIIKQMKDIFKRESNFPISPVLFSAIELSQNKNENIINNFMSSILFIIFNTNMMNNNNSNNNSSNNNNNDNNNNNNNNNDYLRLFKYIFNVKNLTNDFKHLLNLINKELLINNNDLNKFNNLIKFENFLFNKERLTNKKEINLIEYIVSFLIFDNKNEKKVLKTKLKKSTNFEKYISLKLLINNFILKYNNSKVDNKKIKSCINLLFQLINSFKNESKKYKKYMGNEHKFLKMKDDLKNKSLSLLFESKFLIIFIKTKKIKIIKKIIKLLKLTNSLDLKNTKLIENLNNIYINLFKYINFDNINKEITSMKDLIPMEIIRNLIQIEFINKEQEDKEKVKRANNQKKLIEFLINCYILNENKKSIQNLFTIDQFQNILAQILKKTQLIDENLLLKFILVLITNDPKFKIYFSKRIIKYCLRNNNKLKMRIIKKIINYNSKYQEIIKKYLIINNNQFSKLFLKIKNANYLIKILFSLKNTINKTNWDILFNELIKKIQINKFKNVKLKYLSIIIMNKNSLKEDDFFIQLKKNTEYISSMYEYTFYQNLLSYKEFSLILNNTLNLLLSNKLIFNNNKNDDNEDENQNQMDIERENVKESKKESDIYIDSDSDNDNDSESESGNDKKTSNDEMQKKINKKKKENLEFENELLRKLMSEDQKIFKKISSNLRIKKKIIELFKLGLKNRLVNSKVLQFFSKLITFSYKNHKDSKDLEMIFQLLTGHSKFITELLRNKEVIIELLLSIIENSRNKIWINSPLLKILLRVYNCTLSKSDLTIFHIFQLFENEGKYLSKFNYNFGKIIDPHSLINNSSNIKPNISRNRVNFTLKNFPIDKKLLIPKYSGFQMSRKLQFTKIYDPSYFLPLYYHLISHLTLPIKTMVKTGSLELSIMALSSNDVEMRKLGYLLLQKLEKINKRRKPQFEFKFTLKVLFFLLKNLVTEPYKQLPHLVCSLIVSSIPILLKPDHPFFRQLSHLFIKKAVFSFDQSFFLYFFQSKSVEESNQVEWILKTILYGIKTRNDYLFLKKQKIFQLMLLYFNSKNSNSITRTLILGIVEQAIVRKDIQKDFINDMSIISFLTSLLSMRSDLWTWYMAITLLETIVKIDKLKNQFFFITNTLIQFLQSNPDRFLPLSKEQSSFIQKRRFDHNSSNKSILDNSLPSDNSNKDLNANDILKKLNKKKKNDNLMFSIKNFSILEIIELIEKEELSLDDEILKSLVKEKIINIFNLVSTLHNCIFYFSPDQLNYLIKICSNTKQIIPVIMKNSFSQIIIDDDVNDDGDDENEDDDDDENDENENENHCDEQGNQLFEFFLLILNNLNKFDCLVGLSSLTNLITLVPKQIWFKFQSKIFMSIFQISDKILLRQKNVEIIQQFNIFLIQILKKFNIDHKKYDLENENTDKLTLKLLTLLK